MSVRDAASLLLRTALVHALALSLMGRAYAQDAGEDEAQRVLFLMPELADSQRTQLQDALLAQLSLVDAELTIRDDEPGAQSTPAQARADDAKARAVSEHARIVLWLDLEPDGRWLVHIMDVGQGRAVTRRIDARAAQQTAAIEAVAVLTREASRAGPLLLDAAPEERAEPLAEPEPERTSPAPEAQAPPPPVELKATARPPALRLALFYTGADFARQISFSHGIGLGARVDWPFGIFAGLHVAWTALAKPAGPLVVQRIPLGAAVGYRARAYRQLWADLELGFLLDVLQRTTRVTAPNQTPAPDSLRVAVALAPRLRAEYRPAELIGVFISLGLDWALSTLDYETSGTPQETVLSPNRLRPALEAGISLYP